MKKADELKHKLAELEEKRSNQRRMEEDLKRKDDSIDTMNKIYKNMQEENDDKVIQIKQKMKRLRNL